MKCYRFKHKLTGLYFCRSRTIRFNVKIPNGKTIRVYVKSNLSKNGKIYPRLPNWKWLKCGIYDHVTLKQGLLDGSIDNYWSGYYTESKVLRFNQSDWELEEL